MGSSSCCSGGACSPDRREFVFGFGAGVAAPFIAGPFTRLARRAGEADHFVPAEKQLDPAWVRALTERGAPTVYSGKALETIGMPCGGIGAGQLYAGGDGTWRQWKIQNLYEDTGYGAKSYEFRVPATVVENRFLVGPDRGKAFLASPIEARAEYPCLRSSRHEAGHLDVELELFAPFVPLDTDASTLPATFFRLRMHNRGAADVACNVDHVLDAPVALRSRGLFGLAAHQEVEMLGTYRRHWVESPARRPQSGEARVFADFEGRDWGAWKAEGAAFAGGPSRGTTRGQQTVSGFAGGGLVNTFQPNDEPQGRLVSPEFRIERPFINFLVGGGAHAGTTCVRLLVEGVEHFSTTGRNREQLEWASWNVGKLVGKSARIEIVDASSDGWGHVNVDQIEFADVPRIGAGFGTLVEQPDFGEVGFQFRESDFRVYSSESPFGVAADVPAGGDALVEGWLVWHFPNHPKGRGYAQRFPNAREVARHIEQNAERLFGDTLLWHKTFYDDSTLPHWLLERLHAPVSTLATNTCELWGNGRFWAWEGEGCCSGTCTHVWNYAHALARLFPSLERTIREMQDFGEGFHDDGLVGMRGNDWYAADGQAGTILKTYREHLCSADGAFLERVWPKAKKALEYLMKHDADGDGVLEDAQPNTYDIDFFGANTFVGALYLAALRAGEELAKLRGDAEFAAKCRALFERGSKLSDEKLFNGEYFEQKVDLAAHPEFQYADGCLADQLFGQAWAHQLGLGWLYPREHVVSALRSIWKYNWAPDVGPQCARHEPERYFARRGEAGLFLCTWPRSQHPGAKGVRYRDEVWTGIEYQVAGHMLHEGLVTEGLAIIRGIHERYDGTKHNPFNEVECGDHYARAMASWGAYLALCGFHYDGPAGVLGFAPRLTPERFAAAFTGATGWGLYSQQRSAKEQTARIEVRWGELRLARVRFELPAEFGECVASASSGGKSIAGSLARDGSTVELSLAQPLVLARGAALDVALSRRA